MKANNTKVDKEIGEAVEMMRKIQDCAIIKKVTAFMAIPTPFRDTLRTGSIAFMKSPAKPAHSQIFFRQSLTAQAKPSCPSNRPWLSSSQKRKP